MVGSRRVGRTGSPHYPALLAVTQDTFQQSAGGTLVKRALLLAGDTGDEKIVEILIHVLRQSKYAMMMLFE